MSLQSAVGIRVRLIVDGSPVTRGVWPEETVGCMLTRTAAGNPRYSCTLISSCDPLEVAHLKSLSNPLELGALVSETAIKEGVKIVAGPSPVVDLAGVVPNSTNLMETHPGLVLGGAMSFMATVQCDELGNSGNVFHFGPHNNSTNVDSIGLNNQKGSATVGLCIYDERKGASSVGFVRKEDAWQLRKWGRRLSGC